MHNLIKTQYKIVMSQPILIEDYTPRNIVLGKVDEKCVKFYYPAEKDGEFEKIRFQIPSMRIPFDIDQKDTQSGKIFVKNISLSTNDIGSDNNKKRIDILRTKILKTEKYIKKHLPEHLKDKTFYSSLWQGKNKDYKPTFKVSMGFDRDNRCKAGIFDNDNNPVEHTTIAKGQVVSMVIFLDKVWIYRDKIGLNWDVEQIKIHSNPGESVSDKNETSQPKLNKFSIRKDT